MSPVLGVVMMENSLESCRYNTEGVAGQEASEGRMEAARIGIQLSVLTGR